MKKVISLLLTMVMLLGLAVPFGGFTASAATPSSDYTSILASIYDEDTNTYVMTTADHLLSLGYMIAAGKGEAYTGATFALGADITVNTGVQDAVAAGNTSSLVQYPDTKGKTFRSNIDGRGHTISGLYMVASASTSTGFFGYAQGSNRIDVKNLAIVDSYASSTQATFGGVFGQTNLVTTDPNKGLHLNNLYLDIDVVSTYTKASDGANSQAATGTVIGTARSSMIHMDSVVSVGNVTVNNARYVGGLIGQVSGGDGFDVTITNSAYYGTITGASKEVGLIVGRLNPSKADMSTLVITHTVAGGAMSGTVPSNHGAFVGWGSVSVIPSVDMTNNLYVSYCSSGVKTHQGANGFVPNTTGTKLVALEDLTGAAGRTTLANNGFKGWLVADGDKAMPALAFDLCYKPATDSDKIMGALLDGNTYTVSSVKQWLAFGYNILAHGVNGDNYFKNKTISLAADITLNQNVQDTVAAGKASTLTAWPNVGGKYFHGSINGNGHTVSGMYMQTTGGSAGFFGYAAGTGTMRIEDLAIVDSYITSNKAIFGGLFGQTNMTSANANEGLILKNLYLDIDVVSTLPDAGTDSATTASSVGTVAGTTRSSRITMDSVVSVGNITVNGTRYVGGLIGQISGGGGSTVNMTNCAYYGTISGASRETGLLVGRMNPSSVVSTLNVSNCVAGGTITSLSSPSVSGAFLGYSSASVIPSISFRNNLYVTYMTHNGTAYTKLYSVADNVTPTVENNTHTTVEALTGQNASALLSENGFTAWTARSEGLVYPSSVCELWFPSTNTKFVGYQLSEAEGARFSIRLVAVTDSLSYEGVGFKISLTCNDTEIGTKNHSQTAYTVYNTLTAMEKGGSTEYTAAELGGAYIFALNINNVPTGCGAIHFLVDTYHVSNETTVYDGRTMAFTVDSSFADLNENVTPGTGSNLPDYEENPSESLPTTTVHENVGFEGLDVEVINGAKLSDYQAKLSELEANGYVRKSYRVTDYNFFAQYDKDGESLWVSYYGTKKQIRISTDGQLLNLQTTPETVASPVTATVNQYANYASQMTDQTMSPGMGYVIKADNGKLIVIDGADTLDVDGFYAYMQEIYGSEHPVIAAWIFTHGHDDHILAAIGILEKYGENMTVEAIYHSFLSETYNDLDTVGIHARIQTLFDQINRLEIPTVTVRTGMQFYVGSVLTSFMYAPDDLFYKNAPSVSSLNDHSLIFSMEHAGQTIMFLGDAISKAEATCISNWSDREWNAEICQVAHHGIQGVSSALYKKIEPKVLLWTCNMVRYNYNYSRFEHTIYLHSLDVENIIAFNGNFTRAFGQFVS